MSQSTDKKPPQLAPATTEQPPTSANPFAKPALPAHVHAGTVAIESERAIAEVQGALVIAKRFPRDPAAAYAACMEACARPGLADSALYSYKRGGSTVSGASIRLAEELARCWGNIVFGMNELSNRDGVTEMEAYAWDLETNTRSAQRFTVRHIRDTQQGKKELTDERDIYEMGANMGARRMRARILAVLPDDLVEAAIVEVRRTLKKGGEEPLQDRVRKMLVAFQKVGVSQAHVEQRLGKKVGEILPDDLVDLLGVYTSIRDGNSKAADWFSAAALEAPAADNDNRPDGGKGKSGKKKTTKKKAAAKPADDGDDGDGQDGDGGEQGDDAEQDGDDDQGGSDDGAGDDKDIF